MRSLSSLGLFGDDNTASGAGAGTSNRKGTGQEERWNRQLRDDGGAVLVALVGAVTSAAAAAARADATGSAGRGPEGFDFGESEALSAVCVEVLRALVRCMSDTWSESGKG